MHYCYITFPLLTVNSRFGRDKRLLQFGVFAEVVQGHARTGASGVTKDIKTAPVNLDVEDCTPLRFGVGFGHWEIIGRVGSDISGVHIGI